MGLEQREGVLDKLTEKGIVLSGTRLSYSNWFEGARLTETALGHKLKVVVDVGEKWTYLKKILETGEKVPGWTPPPESRSGSWGGGGRRMSPEELDLEREKGFRIGRSVTLERAIDMAKHGITVDMIAPLLAVVDPYVLAGKCPTAPSAAEGVPARTDVPKAPPPENKPKTVPVLEAEKKPAPAEEPGSKPPKAAKAKALPLQAVNALFNEARKAKVVTAWPDYVALARQALGREVHDLYLLSRDEFVKVEAFIRTKTAPSKVA